jgi:type 1 glutamine amidotransferase
LLGGRVPAKTACVFAPFLRENGYRVVEVFYCSPGHAARDFEAPEIRKIVAGDMLRASR